MSIAEKLRTIAENLPKVFKAGQKSEHDRFWDEFQKNGSRQSYTLGFCGKGWTDETFKPKYLIISNLCYQMFQSCDIRNFNADLITIIGGTCMNMFNYSSDPPIGNEGITNITGTLDLTKATGISSLFNYAYNLTNVECIKMPTTSMATTNMFAQCKKLVEIRFDTSNGGYVYQTIDFKSCPLSVESMKSVIRALENYSGTDNEFKYTVSFSSACIAALEAEGNTSPNGNSWLNYITDLGWNRG